MIEYDGQNRTGEECRYYASDFNKFVGLAVRHNFSMANIDTWIYKYPKPSDPISTPIEVKLIETKHTSENYEYKKRQEEMMLEIAVDLTMLNKFNKRTHYELFRLIGDPPYDEVTIYSYMTKQTFTLKGQALKEWIGEDKYNPDFDIE